MLNIQFTPIILLFIIVPILSIVLLLLNIIFAVHRPDNEKVSLYEAGMPVVPGQTRMPFFIQFYIVAILFLVFDLELLVIYPITVSLFTVGSYGFWIVMIFFSILTIGFVYEIGSGALKFMVPLNRSPSNSNNS